MRFPATSAAQYFYMDPARKYVQFNQFTYPALQTLSVVNRATGNAIIQNTSGSQPIWAGNALQGPYSARNNPGAAPTSSLVGAGIAGFTFAGGQYFEHDSVATTLGGKAEAALTIVAAVNPASAGGVIASFADATTDGYLYLSYGSGAFTFSEENTNGIVSVSATVAAATTSVVTAIRANATLTLRVNSAVVAGPSTVTAGTETYTTFCVGALNSNGLVNRQFNGVIGDVAVYGGSADIYEVETYMLLKAGVIRGPTSGTNSGF
jgi:hypothetical protein